MNTAIRTYSGEDHIIAEAALILQSGGLVAFPTETVYGLGANGLDPDAARKIYAAKGRPADNPLILHISGFDQLKAVVSEIPAQAEKLAEAFWPGPLTLIFKKRFSVPDAVTCGLSTVAVRFPKDVVAARLIKAAGFPVAAPSANSSGKPSPTKASHVIFDLSGKIDMIIDGGQCLLGIESTIVDVSEKSPRLLRPGAVAVEDIESVVGKIDSGRFDGAPKAPGMRYKHYSPLACVTVFAGDREKVAAEITARLKRSAKKTGVLATDETAPLYAEAGAAVVTSLGSITRMDDVAKNLFAALRGFDFNGVEEVYAEGFDETGLGLAVMNRLKKASANRVVYV